MHSNFRQKSSVLFSTPGGADKAPPDSFGTMLQNFADEAAAQQHLAAGDENKFAGPTEPLLPEEFIPGSVPDVVSGFTLAPLVPAHHPPKTFPASAVRCIQNDANTISLLLSPQLVEKHRSTLYDRRDRAPSETRTSPVSSPSVGPREEESSGATAIPALVPSSPKMGPKDAAPSSPAGSSPAGGPRGGGAVGEMQSGSTMSDARIGALGAYRARRVEEMEAGRGEAPLAEKSSANNMHTLLTDMLDQELESHIASAYTVYSADPLDRDEAVGPHLFFDMGLEWRGGGKSRSGAAEDEGGRGVLQTLHNVPHQEVVAPRDLQTRDQHIPLQKLPEKSGAEFHDVGTAIRL